MTLIDGKKISQEILAELKAKIETEKLHPKLAIILVGDDPASVAYVSQKQKRGQEIGVEVVVFNFSLIVGVNVIEETIKKINLDPSFQGLIIQLPLPDLIPAQPLCDLVDSSKDVDGLRSDAKSGTATALAVMTLLKRSAVPIKDKKVVVMGASNLVGVPTAGLLAKEGGQVTIIDIDTQNPLENIRTADILVTAVGKPKLVTGEMVKDGVVVIDVGITRTAEGLVGDVDFATVSPKASLITPVPGGVGPMTVAMLLSQVVARAG